jgi:hypothetical protein
MKWESNAQWPIGTISRFEEVVTVDRHTTESAAIAVCRALEKEGYGGRGKHFPLRTWVGRTEDKT